jgi:hypothetical protein
VNGYAKTREGAALVARTARHFAHKVPVTEASGRTSIRTRFGLAELAASERGVSIELVADDAQACESLRDVIADHLERFAREPLELTWFDGPASTRSI